MTFLITEKHTRKKPKQKKAREAPKPELEPRTLLIAVDQMVSYINQCGEGSLGVCLCPSFDYGRKEEEWQRLFKENLASRLAAYSSTIFLPVATYNYWRYIAAEWLFPLIAPFKDKKRIFPLILGESHFAKNSWSKKELELAKQGGLFVYLLGDSLATGFRRVRMLISALEEKPNVNFSEALAIIWHLNRASFNTWGGRSDLDYEPRRIPNQFFDRAGKLVISSPKPKL